jgi:ABC-2 type transport system permease protein
MVGLQYRAAALAGLATQFFWGIILSLIYSSFYKHASVDNFNLSQLMCYVWLNQAFFYLVYPNLKENDIMSKIKNGEVAYELCRPYDLYFWWYIKYLSEKYASVLLRFIPIIILGLLLPAPFKLQMPESVLSFILFVITLLLGSLIICGILMIIQSISFFTTESKGISDIVFVICDLFTGSLLPLPLMPKIIQSIGMYLPFRLISDLPFRVYSGNIGIESATKCIGIQIIWIVILLILGELIMKKALKKVCIQGG